MLFSRIFSRLVFLPILLVLVSVSAASAQMLRFDPDPSIPTEPNFMVPLVLETGGLAVKGVEVKVTFDAALVSLISITPGPWYILSGQDYFFWDYTTAGTNAIHFASAMLDGPVGSDGIIAYCHFTMVGYGTCPLAFVEGDVRDGNNNPLPFARDDGLILLDPAVANQDVSFSALKALYR